MRCEASHSHYRSLISKIILFLKYNNFFSIPDDLKKTWSDEIRYLEKN